MSAARKPVIVRKFNRDWCAGYASPLLDSEQSDSQTPGQTPGQSHDLELLDATGKLLRIDWSQVKWLCYVRELGPNEGGGSDTVNPERLLRRRFTSRPRVAGIWLRLGLADGEELEGIAANDRSLVSGRGLLLTPPDTRSNTQRVFVPRSAIRELTVLGVIQPVTPRRERAPLEPELFAEAQIVER